MAKEQNDNRLDQIKEGAGLEDSRINQEFVDFLRKWSTPVLLVLALIALGYFLNNKRKDARAALVDEAFQQLNLSTSSAAPSPDVLKRIAEDYKSVEGVRVMALGAAADEYLRAVQRGILPGAPLDGSGQPQSQDDYLSEDDRGRFLTEAETLYREVYELTQDDPAMALHALGALYGLAAVSESREDADAAKNMLERASALAEKHGFMEHRTITEMRLTALPELMAAEIDLPSEGDLPEIPALQPDIPELPVDDTVGPTPVGPELPPADGGTAEESGEQATDSGAETVDDQAGDDQTGDDQAGDGDAGDGETGGSDSETDDGGR